MAHLDTPNNLCRVSGLRSIPSMRLMYQLDLRIAGAELQLLPGEKNEHVVLGLVLWLWIALIITRHLCPRRILFRSCSLFCLQFLRAFLSHCYGGY